MRDHEFCRCGQKLNSYNTTGICGACAVAETDDWIRRAGMPQPPPPPPPPRVCRYPECDEFATQRSVESKAPRWRNLCQYHYDQQRAVQSAMGFGGRAAERVGPVALG